jgi:hypothetical protein
LPPPTRGLNPLFWLPVRDFLDGVDFYNMIIRLKSTLSPQSL